MARLASSGATKTKTRSPKMVPQKENTTPTPKALPACPFIAIGRPSKQVAIEDGVPGMFSKIADIKPPDIPPTYKATKVDTPCSGVMV